MSKSVSMFCKIKDTVVPIGMASPAQARILVKKELASWEDGSLLLLLRPAFEQILTRQEPLMKAPFDDENVSQAELDRRLQWFRHVMLKTSQALAPVPQETRLPPDDWYYNEIQKKEKEWTLITRDITPMSDEEADAFFADPMPEQLDDLKRVSQEIPKKDSLYQTSPNVNDIFGVKPVDLYVGPGLAKNPILEGQEPKEVFKGFLIQAKRKLSVDTSRVDSSDQGK